MTLRLGHRTPFRISEDVFPDLPRYEAAFQTSNLDVGTPYPVLVPVFAKALTRPFTDEDIAMILLREASEEAVRVIATHLTPFVRSPTEGLSVEQVTLRLERLLSLKVTPMSPDLFGASKRLRGLALLRTHNDWGPDIVFKAFEDINTVFFGGMLRHRIRLLWCSRNDMIAKDPAHADEMKSVGGLSSGRIKHLAHRDGENVMIVGHAKFSIISLNAALILLGPYRRSNKWDMMWGILLHEMVHAYLHTRTDLHAPTYLPSDKDKHHGVHFERCLAALRRRGAEIACFETALDVDKNMRKLKETTDGK
ncbi:hypothetical protein MMC14_004757 [Varicellaria rhodocarpa]|nr:hypothetical protein [Varicellaria rhodocarpa]